MTKDDMICLAKESSWVYADDDRGFEPLWRFANLVAAAEREACAKACEDAPEPDGADLAERIRARSQS